MGSFAISGDFSETEHAHNRPSWGHTREPGSVVAWLCGNVVSGARFQTTPAQAVVSGYKQWAAECFSRLDGNFCTAIYDPAFRGLRIARDLGGSKPLFYAGSLSRTGAHSAVFGSSAMEVLRAAGLPAIAHPSLVHRYLSQGALAGFSQTLLQGVLSLRRGHYLELGQATAFSVREVEFPLDTGVHDGDRTLEERGEELRNLLLGTIAAQSAGRNTAVALSGGIDSSGILACLRRVTPRGEPLRVYSYLPARPEVPDAWDERSWVTQVAEGLNATLNIVDVDVGEVPARVAAVTAAQDFPFGSPVVIAQDKLFRVAGDAGTDVMLSGHGPDILFGGGDSHLAFRLSQLIRAGRLVAATRMLPGAAEFAAMGTVSLIRAAIRGAAGIEMPEAWGARGIEWARTPWFKDRDAAAWIRQSARSTRLYPMQALISEQLSSAPGATSLLYEERNAETSGVENCLPYLVAASVRLSQRCSAEYLVSDRGETKRVLRVALREMLPAAVLGRRKRIGFAVPALHWLLCHRRWVEESVLELQCLPFFQAPRFADVWARLRENRVSAWHTAFRLWRWLVLLEWTRTHNVRFD